MTIETEPLPLPPSADPSRFSTFGRQVIGLDPGNLTPSDFAEIQDLLYRVIYTFSPRHHGMFSDLILFQHDALLFRDANLSPEQQYALTKVLHPPTFRKASPPIIT
jgi:xanthine dioxygenase